MEVSWGLRTGSADSVNFCRTVDYRDTCIHRFSFGGLSMSLSEIDAKRAILHLSTLGDTDIFPPPFEFRFYSEAADEVVKRMTETQAGQYKPTSCFECLSPKGELSFRIAHQLYPSDTLFYTAAAINVAPAIELLKLDVSKGPFSYRFVDKEDSPRLFSESSNYHDWLDHVKSIYGEAKPFDDVRYVIETDISDFYSRIYFHRLEHVLDDCEAPNAVRKIIEGIIKHSRARQSYGLPVGSAASRILAEGLLADTDVMISQMSEGYSRYVDDFRIVVGQQSAVHSTLCKLAEHLMLTEGLSLNASKTRTSTTSNGVAEIEKKLTDVFNDNEIVKLSQYIRAVYDNEDISIEDIDDIDENDFLVKLSEVRSRDTVDYNAIKVILKALRTLNISDPVSFLVSNIELLYYVPRDFCILLGGVAQRNNEISADLAEILTKAVQAPPYKDMALTRIWVGHLFVTQALPISEQLRQSLKLDGTPVERRQDLLLKGILKDRSYFRAQKTKFDEKSTWEKSALMLGASCLPKGEYKVWLDTIKANFADPFSDIYVKWLTSNQDVVLQFLKEDYVIKSRVEKLIDMFPDLDEPESKDDSKN